MRFFFFFSILFTQPPPPAFFFPEKSRGHFRHDSMTITETLPQEAEQPGRRLVQSKEHLERLTASEEWIINEPLRGNKSVFFSRISVRHRRGREKHFEIPVSIVVYLACLPLLAFKWLAETLILPQFDFTRLSIRLFNPSSSTDSTVTG